MLMQRKRREKTNLVKRFYFLQLKKKINGAKWSSELLD